MEDKILFKKTTTSEEHITEILKLTPKHQAERGNVSCSD